MDKKYIVFDIGGSFIKWAIIDEKFKIIKDDKFLYDNKIHDGNWLIEEVAKMISLELQNDESIKGVGISTAGDVDNKTTEILGSTPNHKNYTGKNWAEHLTPKFKLPLVVDNDANCAALGEIISGGLNNVSDAILITLGTDIGGGIIIDKKIFHGHKGTAGEVGYMNVLGLRWGTFFSAKGLSRLVEKELQIIENEIDILKESKHKEIIEFWYEGLGIGLSNLVALFNPQKIVLGGGLSESKLLDFDRLKKVIDKHLIEKHLQLNYELSISAQGNKSAFFGLCEMLNSK